MLRINLLPIRQLKKRAQANNQIASAVVVFCCVLFILALVALFQSNKISATESRIKDLQAEKTKYSKTLKKIADYKKNTDELERRINVINKLRTDSSLTVHVLDEITNLIDNKRVWLTSLSQQGSSLSLNGVALDNETIAQFMEILKTSPFISSVALGKSTLKGISGKNLKVFNISCSVAQPPPEQSEAVAK